MHKQGDRIKILRMNTAITRGRNPPAELVAEGPVEAMAGEADHEERLLPPADHDPVTAVDRYLDLTVNDEHGGDPLADGDHLVDFVGAVHQRALGQCVGAE